MKKECPPEGRNCVERNRQRAGAGRGAERKPPRARGLPPQRILRAEPSWAGTLLSRIPGGGTLLNAGGDTPQHTTRNRNVPGMSPLGVNPGTQQEFGNMDRAFTDKKGRMMDCRAKSERGKPALVDDSGGTIFPPGREGWWRRRGDRKS